MKNNFRKKRTSRPTWSEPRKNSRLRLLATLSSNKGCQSQTRPPPGPPEPQNKTEVLSGSRHPRRPLPLRHHQAPRPQWLLHPQVCFHLPKVLIRPKWILKETYRSLRIRSNRLIGKIFYLPNLFIFIIFISKIWIIFRSKLPECKVEGTIWKDMHTNKDEAKLYEALDLAEVDKLFSAYQKNGMLFFLQIYCFHTKVLTI